MKENYSLLRKHQEDIINGLSKIEGIVINTTKESCIPGIVNFSVVGHNTEVFIRALSNKGIYVSSRSVCSVEKKDQVSSTLYAMKKDIDICVSSIRVSYDKPLTDEEVNYFILSVEEIFNSLRK